MKLTAWLFVLVLFQTPAASGGPAPPPRFETASVHSNPTGARSGSLFPLGPGTVYANTAGRFRATSIPLLSYISFAYKLTAGQQDEIEKHGPQWLWDGYDIDARAADPKVTKDDMRRMMQSLLADRFHLAVHTEVKRGPAFALRLTHPGSTGPGLHPHPASEPCSSASTAFHVATTGSVPVSCGGVAEQLKPSWPGLRRAGGRNVSLELLAATLPRIAALDLPVVDQTGLTGNYDFILEWAPAQGSTLSDDPFSQGEGVPDRVPSIDHPPNMDVRQTPRYSTIAGITSGEQFQDALKKQLGLKLVKVTAPAEVYILDHIQRPDPN